MNKKKKYKRSKASKRRRAACEANPKLQKTRFIPSSEMDNYPRVNEMIYSFRVCDLGSMNKPGLLSRSLAFYIGSLRDRLLQGENVKANVFLQIGYSRLSAQQWTKKKEMHASGGTNIPTMDLVIPDVKNSQELILEIEQSVRDTVAQLNETSTENIRTVHITVEECNKEKDPMGAFGCPQSIIDPNGRIEQEINYSY